MVSARRKAKKILSKKVSHRKVIKPKVARSKKSVKPHSKSVRSTHELIRVHFSKHPNGSPEVVSFVLQGLPSLLKKLGEKKVGIEIEGLSVMDQSHDPKNPFHVEKRSQVVQLCLRHGLYKSHDRLMAVIPTRELAQVLKDHEWIGRDYLTKIRFCTQSIQIKMIDDFFNVLLMEGEKKSVEQAKDWLTAWCQSPVRFTSLPLSFPV